MTPQDKVIMAFDLMLFVFLFLLYVSCVKFC